MINATVCGVEGCNMDGIIECRHCETPVCAEHAREYEGEFYCPVCYREWCDPDPPDESAMSVSKEEVEHYLNSYMVLDLELSVTKHQISAVMKRIKETVLLDIINHNTRPKGEIEEMQGFMNALINAIEAWKENNANPYDDQANQDSEGEGG